MPKVEVWILLVDFSGTIMIIQKLSQRPFEYQIGKYLGILDELLM